MLELRVIHRHINGQLYVVAKFPSDFGEHKRFRNIMSFTIQRVSPEEAQPGMIVAEPILDSAGQVLFPKDEVLTDRHIRRLVVRGVTEISVQAEAPEADPEAKLPASSAPMDEEALREQLAQRFRHFENNEIMQTIREVAEKHLMRTLEIPETKESDE